LHEDGIILSRHRTRWYNRDQDANRQGRATSLERDDACDPALIDRADIAGCRGRNTDRGL